jgi:hypothetical protein
LWKIETEIIMPCKSDAASLKWIEDKYLELSSTVQKKVPAKVEEAGDILALLGKWEREAPKPQKPRTKGKQAVARLDPKVKLAKRSNPKRSEKAKTKLICDTAQVQAHPLLVGQQGVFAIENLRREDIAFSEVLPVVSKVPAELKGSDYYIAMHHGAGSITRRASNNKHKSVKEAFLVLRMESAAHDSMAYYLNSAGSSSNVLDPNAQGANVMLVVTVGHGYTGVPCERGTWWLGRPARVTARCLRHIAAGEELLWAYDFQPAFPGTTPSTKKAKRMVDENGGAADVTAPVSAALGVVDDMTAPDVRSDDTVLTGRMRRNNAGKHGNTARLPAAATLAQHKKRRMSAYDEIRAIEAAAAMLH